MPRPPPPRLLRPPRRAFAPARARRARTRRPRPAWSKRIDRRSWLLLAAHGDRPRLAVLEIGDPFGYRRVAVRRQREVAAVLLERPLGVAEIEVVEDAEVEGRCRIAGVERDRALVGVARLRELALLAVSDAELVEVDRLARVEARRLLELGLGLVELAGLAIDHAEVGMRAAQIRVGLRQRAVGALGLVGAAAAQEPAGVVERALGRRRDR